MSNTHPLATPSCYSGAGANAGDGASGDQITAANVAKECLLTALKIDSKAAHLWGNLSNAYYMAGDHKSSGKCLEKVLFNNFTSPFQIAPLLSHYCDLTISGWTFSNSIMRT